MSENLAKIVRAKTASEAIEKAAVDSSDIALIATIARHIHELGDSVHFRKYVELCIKPVIDKKIKALRSEEDYGKARYLQGFLDGIDEVLDTTSFEKIYRLKIEKDAKTRTNRK